MISFARIEEIDEIMPFIDNEWRKGHILARDRLFFEWMYVKDDTVNFVISRNDDWIIDGVLGYVPYDEKNTQIALTVWKALKSANGMIGMSMLSFVEKELKPVIIASPGVNPSTTTAIYRYFKHEVRKMDHYYRLAERSDYFIPTINENKGLKKPMHSTAKMKRITSFEEYEAERIIFADNAIRKDSWYIRRRYFEHPIFEYIHYIIADNNKKLDVIIREQEVDGHKCIRVVDLLGDYRLLIDFTFELDRILVAGKYEYIDCYAYSIEKNIWDNAGWLNVEETKNVIPNYFAPFERRNIDLYCSCKPKGIVVLRGDGDQDRPN